MPRKLTIIIPTKNRAPLIAGLLAGLRNLDGLARIQPQIVFADNASKDETWKILQSAAPTFPVPLATVKVADRGKSAAINQAVQAANGTTLAFLDDDVIPDQRWLEAVEAFVEAGEFEVGQGRIQLEPSLIG